MYLKSKKKVQNETYLSSEQYENRNEFYCRRNPNVDYWIGKSFGIQYTIHVGKLE
jgi:hypothetical protein